MWESATCVVPSLHSRVVYVKTPHSLTLPSTGDHSVWVKRRGGRGKCRVSCELPQTRRPVESSPVDVFVCIDQVLLWAVGPTAGLLLLLLLGLMVCCLRRRRKRRKGQSQYEELRSTVPSIPACPAPVMLVSQGSWATSVSLTLHDDSFRIWEFWFRLQIQVLNHWTMASLNHSIQYYEALTFMGAVVFISVWNLLSVFVCERPREIPFTLPPRVTARNHGDLKAVEEKEEEEIKMEAQKDILAHRGSLSISSRSQLPVYITWYLWFYKTSFDCFDSVLVLI